MGAPINRTAKTSLDGNLVPYTPSSSAKLKASDDVIYDYVDGLNQAQDAHTQAATLAHPDGSVKTAKIADGAITEPKYATGSVSSRAIANGAVGPNQLQTGLSTPVDVQAQFAKRGIDVTSAPYNARGDGFTNDTTAIQNAIDDINTSGGGVVFLPFKTYIINSLSLNGMSNVQIISNGATLKQTVDNTAILIDGSSNITIEGLKIQGSGGISAPSSNYVGHGIRVNNTDYFTLKFCEIYKMNNGGVMITESSFSTLIGNYFHDNHEGSDVYFGYGIPTKALTDFYAEGNKCYSSNRVGFYIMGYGEKVHVVNNDVKHKIEYGIMVYDNETVPNTVCWTDVVVTGNTVEDVSNAPDNGIMAGMGIYLQTAIKVVCSNNIVKNVLQGRTDAAAPDRTLSPGAISISGSREVTCVGNVVDTSGIDGIDIVNVQQLSKGCVVANNVVVNVAYTGIYAQACQNVLIQNNMISGSSGSNEGISILSHSGQATKHIIASNNRINGGFKTGISASKGTGTGVEGITIQGNMIQDILNTYLSVSDGDKVSINDNTIMNILAAPTAGSYGILMTRCNNFVANSNLLKGESAALLARGLGCSTGTNGVIANNVIVGVNEISSSMFMASNTNVYIYGNLNPRQVMPMFGDHAIGNSTSSDTNIRLLYRTTIPDASVGVCSAGSLCFNLSPVASGKAGWICVSGGTPGTWKPFGAIDA